MKTVYYQLGLLALEKIYRAPFFQINQLFVTLFLFILNGYNKPIIFLLSYLSYTKISLLEIQRQTFK